MVEHIPTLMVVGFGLSVALMIAGVVWGLWK